MKHSKTVFVILIGATLTVLAQGRGGTPKGVQKFTVVEIGIPELQAAMKQGRLASRELVVQYLTRIALYEDRLNAAIAINPNAEA